MSKEITLPSGATVTLKDASAIRVGDRKKVYAQSVGKEEVMRSLAMIDGVLAMAIEKWSIDLPLPKDRIASLDELGLSDYDFLVEEAKEINNAIFGVKSASNLENKNDPKVITEEPSDSVNSLEDSLEPKE
jgi:hypothetical protein